MGVFTVSVVREYLDHLELGNPQNFEKISVIPVMGSVEESSIYLTMEEALDMNLLTISEVDDSGSVSELKAVNKSELPILILDGEEVVGAKQNRVLNTSVLLKGDSETIIPVSCTEEGRWSYNSQNFYDDGSVCSHGIRSAKRRGVNASLHNHSNYASDQGSIWSGIRSYMHRENYNSPTGAHRDIYEHKSSDINKYLSEFNLVEAQIGLIVFINGKIKGFDSVSSPVAYKVLHDKLLKSYVMEAVLNWESESNVSFSEHSKVNSFINQVNCSNESKFKSIGHGWDHRFESNSILGSALVCKREVIHASFFKNEVFKDDDSNMAGFRMRRGFRGDK